MSNDFDLDNIDSHLEKMIQTIQISWDDLPDDTKDAMEELYEKLLSGYEHSRHSATTQFLTDAASLPGIPERIQRVLENAKNPPLFGSKSFRPIYQPGKKLAPPKTSKKSFRAEKSKSHSKSRNGSTTRGGEEESAPPSGSQAETTDLLRFPNIDSPGQTALNEKISIFIELLLEPIIEETEAIAVADEDPEGEPPQIEVVLRARGFEVSGSNTKLMTVNRDDDSDVRFALTPTKLGPSKIRADFYQNDHRLGTIQKEILVVEAGAEESVEEKPTETYPIEIHQNIEAPPPDLELLVQHSDDNTLDFYLHSTVAEMNYNHAKVGSVKLKGTPLEKFDELYQELTSLAGVEGDDAARMERRLASIGEDLWEKIIPNELKNAYWKFKSKAKTLMITSDEPWIPWEMLKPFRIDDDDEKEIDNFLCQTFQFTRWLTGPGVVDGLLPGQVRPVTKETTNLEWVQDELSFLERIGQLNNKMIPMQSFHRGDQVIDLLDQGGFSILHFACHGNFDPGVPHNSPISLSDGELKPSDIHARFGGKKPRPIIFINACSTARIDFSYTGLGGWANKFVKDVRVGAFIAPMWEVYDKLAATFAQTFYIEFIQKETKISEAFRIARETIRKEAPHDSTWLAYVLYADPEGYIKNEV